MEPLTEQQIADLKRILEARSPEFDPDTYQLRVHAWVRSCFGDANAYNEEERCDRAAEEFFEFLQSLGYPKERFQELLEYVYNRPAGVPTQELGGVLVTLGALSQCVGLNMLGCGELELMRIESPEIKEKIRLKQASKPTGAALPGSASLQAPPATYDTGFRQGYEEAATNAELHG